jgi:pimeloyl-ACP methyl ester carboxylesterase
MRTVQTPLLDIALEDTGPPDGRPVILLHGWPDCPRTWDRMVPTLHDAGLRTLVPYLRGFGPTRFRDAEAMRSGQLSALGRDVLHLADALGLQHFSIVGHDWGARAAYVAACLAPERVRAYVALSVGWGTNTPDQALSLQQSQNYWYQWLMALPRGEDLIRHDRRAFTRHLWQVWNPGWTVSDAEFEVTATAFDNPDWAEVVLHSYRSRWGLAPADPSCAEIETQLAADPRIHVPTLVLHGDADPCNGPETSEGKEALFTAPYRRVLLRGIGHFPQRQAALDVLAEVVPFLTLDA